MTKRISVQLLFLLGILHNLHAQVNLRTEVPNGLLIHANYAVQFPAGDMAKRFGINSMVSGGLDLKRKLWLIGAEGNFLFGNKIKEADVLNNLRNKDGLFVNVQGGLNTVAVFERGWAVQVHVARIVPFKKPNRNSGLKFQLGIGYLEHKLFINANPRLLPQLDKTYRKGYDRLAGGFLMSEFIGYQFFDNRKFINFHLGFEFMQAYTTAYRKYNFDTNAPDPVKHRIDLLFGLKLGWVIPIYAKERQEKFYYN